MTVTFPLPGHPDLRDKVCLVTGASQGIGEATARYLAECGATTVLTARNLAACEETVASITAAGGTAVALQLDVTDDAAVAATVAEVEARYGALHLAFNNAGTQGPAAPLHEQSDATVRQVLEVNLLGVISCLRHEVPAMLRAGGGVIVNTASVGGVVAAPGIGPYCASKHAVVGLSKSAAADYGRLGVRVNVLAPGSVRTPILTDWLAELGALEHMESLTPQGRIAGPAEIAPVVAWMLSDASSFMTGSVVTADGGYTAL
ncbi:MAG: SDR family oxidoreductase [Nocardioides alkalitolerans]